MAAAVPGPKDDGTVLHVPNSTVGMTLTQARNAADVPDWHPDEHPAMPDVVRKGRIAEGVRACGYCHYPNGLGRPENASIAGQALKTISPKTLGSSRRLTPALSRGHDGPWSHDARPSVVARG